jgi:carbon-monoxide dehydrogenase small subunit
MIEITLRVNGGEHALWISPNRSLLDVLHDDLGLAEVRYGCGEGVCGTCTVLVDGEPTGACLTLAVQARGHEITTVGGLRGPDGELHPLQELFLRRGAAQCGFCTPGMLLTALAMLDREKRPAREAIRYELAGNLCRCTGYTAILDAVEEYAAAREEQGG